MHAGELRNLTRAEIIFHTPRLRAKVSVRRCETRTPERSVRIRNASVARYERKAPTVQDSEGEKMLPQRKRSLRRSPARSPHVSSVRSIRARTLQSHSAPPGNDLGPCPYGCKGETTLCSMTAFAKSLASGPKSFFLGPEKVSSRSCGQQLPKTCPGRPRETRVEGRRDGGVGAGARTHERK